MTKTEINNIFDIPIPTLNDWQKPSSKRHKLYLFLIKSDKKYINKVNNIHKIHRLFHILNRNINIQYQYTYNEIQQAFMKQDYKLATQREQIIYAKTFKECDSNDLESLISYFEISKINIKKIYLSSPYRSLKGVAKIWNKRFRLKNIDINISSQSNNIPVPLQLVLNKRALNV
jgi:hypothetical protein